MACQIRHQKLAGRKGNCYYLRDDQVVVRVRAQSELAARVAEGVPVALLPQASPKPTVAQMAGYEPLPADGVWVPPGTSPELVDPRANRAVRALEAKLVAEGLPAEAFDALARAADRVPGSVDRTFLLRAADGLLRCPAAAREATAARLVDNFDRIARWDDGVGTGRAADVLGLAAAHGPEVVELCAAKLIWSSPRTTEAPKVSAADVIAARDRGELRTAFQGTYALTAKGWELAGCETLTRWKLGDRFVPPSQFVSAAPETITDFTLAATIAEFREISAEHPNLTAAVNLTPAELTPSRVADIEARLAASGIAPGVIGIEIVEEGDFDDPTQARTLVEDLRGKGVPAKLDDFGTASSRIEGRRHIFSAVDAVKFDRELVANVHADDTKRKVLSVAVQAFADKRLVAEGAELAEEVDALRGLGVHHVQGYYFATPVPADEFRQLVERAGTAR